MAARMNQQETRARERRRDNTGLQLLGSRSYVPLGLEAPDNVQELVWTGVWPSLGIRAVTNMVTIIIGRVGL